MTVCPYIAQYTIDTFRSQSQGATPHHRVSRSQAEAVHGDARRGRRELVRISQSPHSASLIAHTRLTFSFYNLRNNICALPALWVGLLYDAQALADAEALVSDWTAEEREYLRTAVTKGTSRAISHIPTRCFTSNAGACSDRWPVTVDQAIVQGHAQQMD